MGNNPEWEWGRPSWPANPPRKSVRTPKKSEEPGCPLLLVKVVPLTLVAMWRHRKELFATGALLLVLAGCLGPSKQRPPLCFDEATDKRVPCPTGQWR